MAQLDSVLFCTSTTSLGFNFMCPIAIYRFEYLTSRIQSLIYSDSYWELEVTHDSLISSTSISLQKAKSTEYSVGESPTLTQRLALS
jgi:hypothetical protein